MLCDSPLVLMAGLQIVVSSSSGLILPRAQEHTKQLVGLLLISHPLQQEAAQVGPEGLGLDHLAAARPLRRGAVRGRLGRCRRGSGSPTAHDHDRKLDRRLPLRSQVLEHLGVGRRLLAVQHLDAVRSQARPLRHRRLDVQHRRVRRLARQLQIQRRVAHRLDHHGVAALLPWCRRRRPLAHCPRHPWEDVLFPSRPYVPQVSSLSTWFAFTRLLGGNTCQVRVLLPVRSLLPSLLLWFIAVSRGETLKGGKERVTGKTGVEKLEAREREAHRGAGWIVSRVLNMVGRELGRPRIQRREESLGERHFGHGGYGYLSGV